MGEKITFYKDQWSFVQELSNEEAGMLLKAAFEYSLGVSSETIMETYLQNCDRFLMSAWHQTKEKLDFNMKKELERSQKAQMANKVRWDKIRASKESDCFGRNPNASERINRDSIAFERTGEDPNADLSIPTNNILHTTNNKKHAVGKNGKTFRILDDGVAYHWDDNSPVKDGESVG